MKVAIARELVYEPSDRHQHAGCALWGKDCQVQRHQPRLHKCEFQAWCNSHCMQNKLGAKTGEELTVLLQVASMQAPQPFF